MSSAAIDAAGLQRLVSTLIDGGYRVVDPTLSDNAIVLVELTSGDAGPSGGPAAPEVSSFTVDIDDISYGTALTPAVAELQLDS